MSLRTCAEGHPMLTWATEDWPTALHHGRCPYCDLAAKVDSLIDDRLWPSRKPESPTHAETR